MKASARLLPDSEQARRFLREREVDGGFTGKSGKGGPDLYYTVFGLECQIALGCQPAWEKLVNYLSSFGHGENLDFIHQTCLLRCWANVPSGMAESGMADSGMAESGMAVPAMRRTGVPPVQAGPGSPRMEGTHTAPGGDEPIQKRGGAYLPHWTKAGACYAISFRMADSLPEHVLQGWQREREDIVRRAARQNRKLTTTEHKELARLYSDRIDSYLDAGRGSCRLKDPAIAALVQKALQHFDGQRYNLLAWCVMPNHVHVVAQPLAGFQLHEILHSWKSFTAKEANRILGSAGRFWQEEYYDHLIRDEEDFNLAVTYATNNPSRAGLDNWPWCGARQQGRDGPATGDAHATLDAALLAGLEAYRGDDGGYSVLKNGGGSIYACFLAMGAYMDRGVAIPAPDRVAACLNSLRTGDGAYANEAALPIGTLPATAAAVAIQLYLGREIDPRLMGWMLSCEAREGGLAVFPHWRADLLSTATGLFAISQLPGGPDAIARVSQRCTEFVLGLWHKSGSFRSDTGMSEAYLDCEYLWYGLLAMGCLAMPAGKTD